MKAYQIINWPPESKQAAQILALKMGISLRELVLIAVDKYVKEKGEQA